MDAETAKSKTRKAPVAQALKARGAGQDNLIHTKRFIQKGLDLLRTIDLTANQVAIGNATVTLREFEEEIEVLLRERLVELEALEADGAATLETIGSIISVRYLLASRELYCSPAPKRYGEKSRPILVDFDRKTDKWGNA